MVKTALVLGTGRCVWDDVLKAGHEGRDIIAVNDIGMHWPGNVKVLYSNDAQMLPKWERARRPEFAPIQSMASNHPSPFAKHYEQFVSGNSAVNAALLAQSLEYDEIIVCGCPCDDSGHYFDAPWIKTGYNNDYQKRQWSIRASELDRCRAVSGVLVDILGEYNGSGSD